MKQIFKIFFLLFFVVLNAQDNGKNITYSSQISLKTQNDFSAVLKSLDKSTAFKKYLSKKEGIYVKSINNQVTDFKEEGFILRNKKFITYANASYEDLQKFLIIDCVIYYSTQEISIKILDNNSKTIDSLLIKLID
jgi:hypothetical protein